MRPHAEVYFNILLPKERIAACRWSNVAQKDNINLPAWNHKKENDIYTYNSLNVRQQWWQLHFKTLASYFW